MFLKIFTKIGWLILLSVSLAAMLIAGNSFHWWLANSEAFNRGEAIEGSLLVLIYGIPFLLGLFLLSRYASSQLWSYCNQIGRLVPLIAILEFIVIVVAPCIMGA